MKQLLWREQCMDTERRKSAPAPAKPQAEGVTIPTVAVSHAEPGLRVQDIPTEVYKVGTTLVNSYGMADPLQLFCSECSTHYSYLNWKIAHKNASKYILYSNITALCISK